MKTRSKTVMFASALFALTAAATPNAIAQQNILIGNATANDTQATVNEKFAELINKYSNGKLKAGVRHGQALGSNTQMVAALQAGSIAGMVLPSGFISSTVPDLSLFDLPFLLPGAPAKVAAFAAQSKTAEKMKELAAQRGIIVIGFHGIGPQSFLSKFPINTLADIHGKKMRVLPSPPRVGAYQDWGAVPRPMELGEVYTALQQGTLDGMENPPDVLYKMKLHEVAKHYTITEHFAFASNVIVSRRWLEGQPKDVQEAVIKAGKEAIQFADVAYTESQQTSLDALRKEITVTTFPAAELQKMKDLSKKGVWERFKADPQRGPMVKLLEEDVERFAKM